MWIEAGKLPVIPAGARGRRNTSLVARPIKVFQKVLSPGRIALDLSWAFFL